MQQPPGFPVGAWISLRDGTPCAVVGVSCDGRAVVQERSGHTRALPPLSDGSRVEPLPKWIVPGSSPLPATCESCRVSDASKERPMLICGHCRTFWHVSCSGVSDARSQKAVWFCEYCSILGRRVPRGPAASVAEEALGTDSALGVLDALTRYMPGPWTRSFAAKLHNLMVGERTSGKFQRVGMNEAEFVPLVQAIDFSALTTVLDPWCGTGTTKKIIGPAVALGGRVILSDLDVSVAADHHGDALDPAYLGRIAAEHGGGFDAVVTSPRFDYADLSIHPLLAVARRLVVVHLSSAWLANPTEGRSNFLSRVADEGLLHIIVGSEKAQTNWKAVFVCIFKTKEDRERLLSSAVPKATVSFGVY